MENRIEMVDITVDATRHNPAVRLAKGYFQRWRRAITYPLVALFLLAPWLQLNEAPLLWMDLSSRELHVLGLTFWPDDLLILTWMAFAAAFGLFAVATFAGRLWCGFSCPQTVWTMMFIWVEEKIQGSRNQRLKEQGKPLKEKRLFRLVAKHVVWWLIALVTGFTFVAFFETGQGLASAIVSGEAGVSVWFWIMFFASLTYINGGWLREQVCMHMCPYSRFQSVMLDRKSLKVTYDVNRGEPRIQKGSQSSSVAKSEKGDCVDCNLCVQVCPVGIDIRDGLQYACIDCAACIDACDEVMSKVKKPTGLIRFDFGEFAQTKNATWRFKDLLTERGKLWGYSLLFALFTAMFVLQIIYRETLDVHFTRDRGQLYFYNGNGELANRYGLKLHNKTQQDATLDLSIARNGMVLNSDRQVTIGKGESRTIPVEVQCQFPCEFPSRTQIDLVIKNAKTQETWSMTNQFFVPQ